MKDHNVSSVPCVYTRINSAFPFLNKYESNDIDIFPSKFSKSIIKIETIQLRFDSTHHLQQFQ